MTQYIDKAAIVAEIENIEADAICEYNSNKSRYAEGSLDVIHRIKNLLDTLEVKEVDLNREIDSTYRNYVAFGRQEIATIAKHFFELGMAVGIKAKKGE